MKTLLIKMLLACCAVAAFTPCLAQIAYTGLYIAQGYNQTTEGLSYAGSYLEFELATVTANSFTSGTVTVPGATSPLALNWHPALQSNGYYGLNYVDASFPSSTGVVSTNLATLYAAFPLGAYSFVANNSDTGSQQAATLRHDADYWPTTPAGTQTAVPALTGSSFAALQGLNAGAPVTLHFNSFIGNAVRCCNETAQTNPYAELVIYNAATGAAVYNSGRLAASTGSVVLPTNTLQVNTSYTYSLSFEVSRHCGIGQGCDATNPVGSYLDWGASTSGAFSPMQAPPPDSTTVNLQGGTLEHPAALQSEGRIGQVNGSIGGAGAQDFYVFYWSGGLFQANARLYGADPLDEFQFELLDQHGTVLETFTLNKADNFTANLSHILTSGPNYEIGLIASMANIDPAYSITLLTPITSVPEPSTSSLAFLGLMLIGFTRWRMALGLILRIRNIHLRTARGVVLP